MKPPSPLYKMNETVKFRGKECVVRSASFALSNQEIGQHCWHYRLGDISNTQLIPESQIEKVFEPASVNFRELMAYVNK